MHAELLNIFEPFRASQWVNCRTVEIDLPNADWQEWSIEIPKRTFFPLCFMAPVSTDLKRRGIAITIDVAPIVDGE